MQLFEIIETPRPAESKTAANKTLTHGQFVISLGWNYVNGQKTSQYKDELPNKIIKVRQRQID